MFIRFRPLFFTMPDELLGEDVAAAVGLQHSQKAEAHKANSIVEPATPLEESLLRIWRQVLEIDNISVSDQFLDVGGDSLLATKLIMSIRRELDVDLPPVELFEAPTIRDQADLIAKQGQSGSWQIVGPRRQ